MGGGFMRKGHEMKNRGSANRSRKQFVLLRKVSGLIASALFLYRVYTLDTAADPLSMRNNVILLYGIVFAMVAVAAHIHISRLNAPDA
jgi:hypothetical protein